MEFFQELQKCRVPVHARIGFAQAVASFYNFINVYIDAAVAQARSRISHVLERLRNEFKSLSSYRAVRQAPAKEHEPYVVGLALATHRDILATLRCIYSKFGRTESISRQHYNYFLETPMFYIIQCNSPQRRHAQTGLRRIELDVDGGKEELFVDAYPRPKSLNRVHEESTFRRGFFVLDRESLFALSDGRMPQLTSGRLLTPQQAMSRLSATIRSFTPRRTLCALQINFAKAADQNGGEHFHSPLPGPSKRCASTMSPRDTDKDFEAVIKIVQRFRKEPQNWPVEEQPFGIIERTFVGTTMHPVELRPERGFVNMVPIGFMMFRHFFRKLRAKGNFELFKSTGIFDEEEVRQGAKRVFEVISQHATKDNMNDLVKNNVCGQELIDRFEGASSKMSPKQRELLNLTEKDIYAIAPGVLGPFQLIRPVSRSGSPYISYSLLCCAFYKKQMLFNAVRNLPLMEEGEKVEFVSIPPDYGYAAPRLIFGFTTFGNRIIGRGKPCRPSGKLGLMANVAVQCSRLLTSLNTRRSTIIGCAHLSAQSADDAEFADLYSLAKVWNRAPLRTQNRYPADQKAFSLTRDSTETTDKYQNDLCFKDENNLVLTKFKGMDLWTKTLAYLYWLKTKFVVLGATPTLPMSDEDLVRGGQKVFRTILDAVVGRNVESLAPLMLRRSALDLHRKMAWNLKDKQRDALMVTDADFVGHNGFVYNWDGFGTEKGTLARMMHSASIVPRDATGEILDHPHFRYSIVLAALLRKNELYKMVRQLPFNFEKERMILRMPPNYGFVTPRYVVMKIEMCHQVINIRHPYAIVLGEDGLIYDFHIHSF
ncbi:unnamed protein product [Cylicocyclus nassatus]|uniref:Uncharacterized protein n=1 Tax=Cylicocyclus nassatus TaxID=53992 RepID=A0AA36GUM8_CYLNA|nr:unnamed protein product [Cylicocyclus nassatus]